MLRYLGLPFLFSLFAATCLCQTAATPRPQASPRPIVDMSADKNNQDDKAPLTTFEEEMRAKRNIRLAEKEYEENIKRAREVSQLAKDMQQLAKAKPALSRDDYKKVERLEKLTKKIRGEAGGEDEEVEIVDKPTDLSSALNQIGEKAEVLAKDVQNTPRQVVSASVIGNANVLLELIKLLRSFTRQTGN
jgi:vacuolar-type H+-ATPase subunit I/STV1